MTGYLLDTTTCIDLIRPHARRERLRSRLREAHLAGHAVTMSVVTLAELQCGCARSTDPSRNRVALVGFVALVRVVTFDEAAARVYGEVRAGLEAAGRPIGPLDTLIAAHALTIDAVLVTSNTREFRRIHGLTVEDWRRA